jgi:phage N-6-adenine-methyltransferase
MINKGLYSSNKDDWETPDDLWQELYREFWFGLDACASNDNYKCWEYFTIEDDALKQDWSRWNSVFMNPPYGKQIGKFVKKAYEESLKGCTVVCLLPARTDTAWFHDYCKKGEIRFIRGRIRFSNAKWNAPFPSMIVIFKPELLKNG